MKKNKRLQRTLALLLVSCFILSSIPMDKVYGGASSHSNAKEFYDSTGQDNGKHSDVINGMVYFATQAKLAASSSNLRYATLGFDVTFKGNDKSVSFAVKRGGSLAEVPNSSVESGGYQYILYRISTQDLIDLVKSTGNVDVDTVLSASEIEVRMDAIMTTVQGDTVNGSIEENDSGGITETNTVYHLNDPDDLKTMKDTFSGHFFKSYMDIPGTLYNYQLSILYSAGDGASAGRGYSTKNYSSGGTTISNAVHNSDGVVMDKHRLMQEFNLKSISGFGLSKKGYHINSGSEWKMADGSVYNSTETYNPKKLEPGVGHANKGVILYANWKPNNYTVKYDNNGGLGVVPDSSHTYDTLGALRKNSCYKEGYTLIPGEEWNTEPDGSGKPYGSGDYVKNLTAENGGTVTLYANWQEATYGIETNKDGGSGGTDIFYEQYTVDWFSDVKLENSISSILKPNKAGYNFAGYYTYYFGMGDPIVDAAGMILKNPDYFNRNSVIYAKWEPKTFSIFFDKQGGSGGWDSVKATFDAMVPFAGNSPTKTGHSFMGYFTEKNGKGTRYYNEHMSGEQYYRTDGDMTLFAYWLDQTPPIVTINAPIVWSNGKDASGNVIGLQIFCKASDVGSGLDRVELYCGDTLVDSRTGLNGAQTCNLEYKNETEGVLQFRVVAYDKTENRAESYATVRYDSTAPTGELTVTNYDKGNYGITITTTDYKIP